MEDEKTGASNGTGHTSVATHAWPARHDEVPARAGSDNWRELPLTALLARVEGTRSGLSSAEAKRRLARVGFNELAGHNRRLVLAEFFALFLNPLVAILLIASAVSALLGEIANAGIILIIVSTNIVINFTQVYRSQQAIDALRQRVALTAAVIRDGHTIEVPRREVVPGDVIRLTAGQVVPADGCLLEAKDLFVNEAALTGESLPVEKEVPANTEADPATAMLFGTSVMSGTGTMLAVVTGPGTEFGRIAARLASRPPENEFERGIRRFAYLITRLVVMLVLFVFFMNIALHRDLVESFLFALALAIGLTPELLPMISSVTMAHGAVQMARQHVIVKRLPAIQNFGSMDILCSDKTGTLTAGAIVVGQSLDPLGVENDDALRLSVANSTFQTGMANPLDVAILAHGTRLPETMAKVDEIPFDFTRRRVSVVVDDHSTADRLLITKGAPESILAVSTSYRSGANILPLTAEATARIHDVFAKLSADGYRALGVAMTTVARKAAYGREDEAALTFVGFITFVDPPKPDAYQAVKALASDGVALKIMTGDNELVAAKICRDIGLDPGVIVTGTGLSQISDSALGPLAERTAVFARVTPDQKNRIIRALQTGSHVVGFLGDGINDAPSLHSADVGISVANAAEVAREAADIILLESSLRVLHLGVIEGRKSFGNVMKYILMGLSSNFGNMFSMAGATLILPFLPMLPSQVLLNNLLYDTSQLTLPTDAVDSLYTRKPKHWDIPFIQRFMLVIGPLSSLFDFLTFFVMRQVFHASEAMFHTGWFIESLATQTLVIYVIRTFGNPLQSRPSRPLVISTLGCVGIGLALPLTPLADTLGFVRPPGSFFVFLVIVVVAYLGLVQLVKMKFACWVDSEP